MSDENETSNLSVVVERPRPEDTVDAVTRARVASLSARNVSDMAISDVLLLTIEQVLGCKNTEEYKKKYAEVAEEIIQAQIDRDEGWDAIETRALEVVFETLKYNRDPKYALSAAALANKAERRNSSGKGPHIIDNSGQTNNVIVLNLNKTYVNNVNETGVGGQAKVINQPQKRNDLPSPKIVEALLAPVTQEVKKPMSDLEKEFELAGVVFPHDD